MSPRRCILICVFPSKCRSPWERRLSANTNSQGVAHVLVITTWVVMFLSASPVGLFAQNTLPASLESSKTLTPERQTLLRAELERNIALIEAQSAVLKTVAKLVGPSVVFIESQHAIESRQTRQQNVQE